MQKHNFPGKFIVFEGPDGSGQTTQANLLKDFLEKENKQVFLTKEPTLTSEAGKKIRLALDKKIILEPAELQRLFIEDRREHLQKLIEPLLREGTFVVSDRYFWSTMAFGAGPGGLNLEWLIELNKDFLYPDLTLILEVSPSVCIERIGKRDKEFTYFEQEEKLAKVLTIYRQLAQKFEQIYLLNGERPIEEIFEEVKKIAVERYF